MEFEDFLIGLKKRHPEWFGESPVKHQDAISGGKGLVCGLGALGGKKLIVESPDRMSVASGEEWDGFEE